MSKEQKKPVRPTLTRRINLKRDILKTRVVEQPVYCRACGKQYFTSFKADDLGDQVCSSKCKSELLWRKSLARRKKPYEPCTVEILPRHITIAELDRVPQLDGIIRAILDTEIMTVERYSVPEKPFRDMPPDCPIQFPAVTFWYHGGIDDFARYYGLSNALHELKSLYHSLVGDVD